MRIEPPQRWRDSLREISLRSHDLVEGRDEDESDTRVLGQQAADDLSYRVLVLTARAAQPHVVAGGLIS
jgi:hypothetical protein